MNAMLSTAKSNMKLKDQKSETIHIYKAANIPLISSDYLQFIFFYCVTIARQNERHCKLNRQHVHFWYSTLVL